MSRFVERHPKTETTDCLHNILPFFTLIPSLVKPEADRGFSGQESSLLAYLGSRRWRDRVLRCKNLCHQCLKSRLFLQWIQHRIDLEKDEIEPGSFLVAAFEAFDRLILFPQRHVQQGIAVRGNVAMRTDLRQLRQNL